MTQCRDCGQAYDNAAASEPGLCQACMPKWLRSAQETSADYARQWQTERIRAENLAALNRELLAALKCVAAALCQPETYPADVDLARKAAADAIAKAKGEA